MKSNSAISLKSLAILVLFSLFLYKCSDDKTKEVEKHEIEILKIQKTSIPISMEIVGNIDGLENIDIEARVEGYLQKILFNEGEYVHKGDSLFVIDDQIYQNELITYQADLETAKANYIRAKSDVERYEPLVKANAMSEQELDAAIAQKKSFKAKMKKSNAQIEQAKEQLSYCYVQSPVDGVIGQSEFKIGSLVGKFGTNVMATVSRVDTVYAVFDLPEITYLHFMSLAKGKTIDEKLKSLPPVELILATEEKFTHKGKITVIDRAIDPITNSIKMKGIFKNPEGILRPGGFVRVRFTAPSPNSIIIPQEAVFEIQGKQFVYVINKSNIVQVRGITTIKAIENVFIVDEGLNEGEIIAAVAYAKINEGSVIIPKGHKPNNKTE